MSDKIRYCKECGSKVLKNVDDWDNSHLEYYCQKCETKLHAIDTKQDPPQAQLQEIVIAYYNIHDLITQLESLKDNPAIGEQTVISPQKIFIG